MTRLKPSASARSGQHLPRSARLRGHRNFESLIQQGSSFTIGPLRWVYLQVQDATQPGLQVAFAVPKRRHKRAVQRNLIKRRLREVYRKAKAPLTTAVEAKGIKLNLLLVYQDNSVAEYAYLAQAVQQGLARLLQQKALSNPDEL